MRERRPPEQPEQPADPSAEAAAAEAAENVEATPAAEELAAEEDVDLAEVEGTGADGRVTKADVEEALEPVRFELADPELVFFAVQLGERAVELDRIGDEPNDVFETDDPDLIRACDAHDALKRKES